MAEIISGKRVTATIGLLAGAATCVLAIPTAAWAGPPVRDGSSSYVDACGVQLRQDVVLDGEKIHVVSDTEIRITGVFKVRWTNENTEQSILVNISGPGTITTVGENVIFEPSGRSGGVALDGHLGLTDGPDGYLISLTDGSVTETKVPPHQQDLCSFVTQ